MKNTFKKVVSVVLLVAFIVSLTVFVAVADSTDLDATVTLITDVDPSKDKLSISVTPEKSDKWVTVVITDENGSPLEVLQQAATSENSIQFSLVGVTPAQIITVKISVAPSNKTKIITAEYFTNAQQQKAIADIMDPTLQITEDIAKYISLDLSGDIQIINKVGDDPTEIPVGVLYLKQLLREEYEGQSNIDVEQFVASLNSKIEAAILSSKDKNIISSYMEREKVSLGISSLDEYGWYSKEFSSEAKDLVLEKIAEGTYDSAEKFVRSFKGQAFLQKLSTQYSSKIIDFLEKNAKNQFNGDAALVLNLSGYNSLEDFQKSYFETLITGIRHNSISDFKKDFDDKLTTASEYVEDSGSGDSGSGSGTGGGSGFGGGAGSLGTITGSTDTNGNVVLPSNPNDSEKGNFKDIDLAPWANEAIKTLAQAGVVHGIDGENFDPLGIVTKEQFVQIVVGAFDVKHNGNSVNFTDVPAAQWYSNAIEVAAVNGIIFGINDSQFGLGSQITRQDMAAIIYRIAVKQNIKLEKVTTEVPADIETVPEYAREAVTALYQAGIIYGVGDGRFAPNDIATRAQAAKIIYELRRLK